MSALAEREEISVQPYNRFWDRVADRYARSPVADEATYQKKLQITREYLRPDMTLFEFGCGTGSTALVHAPHVKQIRAVDISARMVEIAKGKAEAAGIANVSFERAAIDDLEVADESYDMVLGLSILHLLEDKEAVIAKVHRMLKPGGLFVSSTACMGDTQRYFGLILPIGRVLGFFPLVRIFKKAELEASLVAAGFRLLHNWQPGKGKSVFIVAEKTA